MLTATRNGLFGGKRSTYIIVFLSQVGRTPSTETTFTLSLPYSHSKKNGVVMGSKQVAVHGDDDRVGHCHDDHDEYDGDEEK